MENKIVVVTGGTSGIGLGIAKKLSQAGATVVIIARDEVKGKAIQSQVNGSFFLAADVTNEETVKETVVKIIANYKKIDVVVNAAGMDVSHPDITSLSMETYAKLMDTNFKSIVLMTKYTIPYLKAMKGVMVNIASQFGMSFDPEVSIYCAAKAAAISFTKSMAKEYGKDGVRINAVCPGGVQTPLLQQFFKDEKEMVEWYKDPSRVPLKRIGQPEDIAEAVYFLASDKASYITGTTLLVDGGSSI